MAEDRKFPIAHLDETFGYSEVDGEYFSGEIYGMDIEREVDLIHVTVLKIARNYFTNMYVYKLRRDHSFGFTDEGWYTEAQVREMKGMKE